MAKKETVNKSEDKKVESLKEANEIKKVEPIKEVESIEEVKENEEVSELKKQIEEMKKAMEALIANTQNANVPSNNVIVREADDEVEIGTRMIQGIGFTSTDETISLKIDYNQLQALSFSEIKKLLRQSEIRKLFEDGICYFSKEEDYKLLGIRSSIDLSTENLQNILTSGNLNEIIRTLNVITSNLKNSTVVHCLIYRICDMIRKGDLAKMDYTTRTGLSNYFKLSGFENGIKTLNDLDMLRG